MSQLIILFLAFPDLVSVLLYNYYSDLLNFSLYLCIYTHFSSHHHFFSSLCLSSSSPFFLPSLSSSFPSSSPQPSAPGAFLSELLSQVNLTKLSVVNLLTAQNSWMNHVTACWVERCECLCLWVNEPVQHGRKFSFLSLLQRLMLVAHVVLMEAVCVFNTMMWPISTRISEKIWNEGIHYVEICLCWKIKGYSDAFTVT